MRALTTLLAGALLAAPLFAQRDKDKPRNDPTNCPYCRGDAELMAQAGIKSHGGFVFGTQTTDLVDQYLATSELYWIESEHFELALGLPSIKVTQDEKEKVRAELARLNAVLPDVPLKPKTLDSWLRAHLYAQRLEDLWKEMTALLDVQKVEFPTERIYNPNEKYFGIGLYLGMPGKYEVLLLPSEGACSSWLRGSFGLITRLTQRWHITDLGTLLLAVHTEQGQLKVDEALHGHVVFNTSIMMLNGYKYYSYDTPIWICEGVAHYLERRVNPKYNTFDSSEGATATMTRKKEWEPPAKRMVAKGEAISMAQLMRMRGFAELDSLEHHYTTWSMVDYLEREHPGFLAKLLGGIKGLLNDEGLVSGSKLPDAHRDMFKEHLNMT
jgi:hypothetical protein